MTRTPCAIPVLALSTLLIAALAGAAYAQAPPVEQPGAAEGQERAASPGEPGPGSAIDLLVIQGLLDVQGLDGWLLYDYRGQNPIARALVNPSFEPTRRWFYLIPATGEPLLLVHAVDATGFALVPGRTLEYASSEELTKGLRTMLAGKRRLAMEYSPRAELPGVSRVDAGTLELVRSRRIKVSSSAELVQVVSSRWGAEGRISHYTAAHHLGRLRRAALELVATRVRQGVPVTEHHVHELILRGYAARGLVGPPPMVAAGAHTAIPGYRPAAERSATIERGDVLMLQMSARLADDPRAVYASTTWMAYVGARVPAPLAGAFAAVTRARDQAVALIADRVRRRRAVKAFEVDARAREAIRQAGHRGRFRHRTGQALTTDPEGAGPFLDSYELRDTRTLIAGTGYAIAPAIYLPGEHGVRAEVDLYIVKPGEIELTTELQAEITPILAR